MTDARWPIFGDDPALVSTLTPRTSLRYHKPMARNKSKSNDIRIKPNGARRDVARVAQRRLRVYFAWSHGEAQHAIAEREKVHPGQITRDLNYILGELHARDLDKADENRRRMLGEIAWQKQELRAAWERSKKPKDRKRARRTEGVGQGGKGERRDAETVTEGRDGNPKFLAEIARLELLEARLLGLCKDQVEHTGPDGGPITHTVLTDAQRCAALQRLYVAVGRSHRSEPASGKTDRPDEAVPSGLEPETI